MSSACLDTLSVEIVHHIFDYLDIQTIFFSCRSVCKRLYSVANSYTNYYFDFQSISKSAFYSLCRRIPFEQVVSLTLSNADQTNGQIRLFLSLFNLNKFIRLRSLHLIRIEDHDLAIFLNYIRHSSVTSLSIDAQIFKLRCNTSLHLLSSTIECHTLRKFDLNLWGIDMAEFQWPVSRTIKHLRIRIGITLDRFYRILQHSPCLQTIILRDFNIDDTAENLPAYDHLTRFLQLKSLTCKGGHIHMDKLESCLSLIPSLTHLKLIAYGDLYNSSSDGHRWEQIITSKLPLLRKFEVFITILTRVKYDTSNIEQIISGFRTPFWLDEQHCFVRCDCTIHLHRLILYSIPICDYHVEYYTDKDQVSAWNYPEENNDPVIIMNNVKQLEVDLSRWMNGDEMGDANRLLFRSVTDLTVGLDDQWPQGALRFLSTTIDLLCVGKLSLSVNFLHESMPSIISGVKKLLQYAVNIHTLSLLDYTAPENCTTNVEAVCLMITSNIKHLRLRVKNSDDMKVIIDNLEHLISVTFEYTHSLVVSRGELIAYLSESKRRSSMWECQYALYVWFDQQ